MTFGKSIGLDVGLKRLKAVSLSRKGNSFFLDAFSSIDAPLKGMISESIFDEDEMSKALRRAVNGLKTGGTKANIALPDNKVYTKVVEMPVLSEKELSFAIHWEAERHIPVALSTITLVWNILYKPATRIKDEKMQVLLVGAPTAIVGKYQKIFRKARLTINSIETETLAITRALVVSNMPPTIILSIGSSSSSLAIIKEGILVLTYSIQVGGEAISRSLEADFGLTASQSEEYKKSYGLSSHGIGEKIAKSAEPILMSILLEIKKAIAFYSQKYKDNSLIQQIILSGGTGKLPGIDLFFAKNLGIETVVANPWKSIVNKNLPAEVKNSSDDYTIALGLAMRGV